MDTKNMELHSKSGEVVPPKGVKFPVTRNIGGEEKVIELTLRETLVGLFTQPRPEKPDGRSQAMTFASFAVQKGFTSEEAIIERYPDVAVRLVDGQPDSRAWRLISLWSDEIENERNLKAAQSQRENGKQITQGQVTNALLRIEQLKTKDANAFSGMIKRLGDLVSQFNFDADEPKGGDMSLAIAGAYKVLGINRPSTNSTASASAESTEEEPF